MDTAAVTYHITHCLPPRLFKVTFDFTGEHVVTVECDGSKRPFRFNGKGYRPGKKADRLALIEKFLDAENRGAGFERVNAELLHPGSALRGSMAARELCRCHDDRQLPAGDRT
jgi:hypothetical protein